MYNESTKKYHDDCAKYYKSLTDRGLQGSSPMQCACAAGHLDIAQWLHSEGAAVDAVAVELAQTEGHLEMSRWLESIFVQAPGAHGLFMGHPCRDVRNYPFWAREL